MFGFGVFLMQFPESSTLRDAIVPPDVQVYTISSIEYCLWAASILSSFLFLKFGWIPLKIAEPSSPVVKMKEPFLQASGASLEKHRVANRSRDLLKLTQSHLENEKLQGSP
jgi:hypothetical protein